ncbi:inositol monophosphatase family protein [Nocardia aurantiaca]|uniref:Inositol monophosphatase n=1 Tax=Nocardia aurantiaca TaxID=2675850 RepID=A0A6I3KZB1_9NOCA|nr:inositol monophosphatase [Nocardia aurantiaca]MTE16053.1 inositol monophosphatase [Nocardia aurantiaca]
MDYDALSQAIAAIAEQTGAELDALARPTPPATLAELESTFDAVDSPAAERIRQRLRPLMPEAAWFAGLFTDLPEQGAVWVVDAIDGAVQYLQGLPQWCVSITLVQDRRPIAAALHSPALAETYRAATEIGAFRDNRPIAPSTKTVLDAALVATSQPPFPGRQAGVTAAAGRTLTALLEHAAAVRNFGPTSWQIADTAAGRVDAFWLNGIDDTNLLAGALIAEQAGSIVTDITGQPWIPGASGFLTAPSGLHSTLVGLLNHRPG